MVGHVIIVTLALHLLRLGTSKAEEPFLYSRFVVEAGWVLMSALLVLWRLAIGRILSALFTRGLSVRRVLVAGFGDPVIDLAASLEQSIWLGDKVVGLVGGPHHAPSRSLGEFSELHDIVAGSSVEVVWLSYDEERHADFFTAVTGELSHQVRWAMPQEQYYRFLDGIATSPLTPEQLSGHASSRDELVTYLGENVEHQNDPLVGARISFVGCRGVPASYGGVEKAVHELSWRLVKSGYRVAVYCRPHYCATLGTYRGVELRRLPCLRTKHFEAISHTVLATIHLLFKEDDIVHYQALGPSLLSWLPRLFGRRTVVTVQGLDWQRRKWGRFARGVLKVGEITSARCPNRTIVVSKDLQNHYRRRYGLRTTYIPNGVDIAEQRPADEIRSLGLEEQSYILSIGRLVPEKGFDTLLKAFSQVKTTMKLVIVGGGSHSESYVTHLHSLADSERVKFPGYVYGRILEELFSNAFLFVSASELEGLPFAVLEAMSFGTPVVATDIPPHEEILGGLGYLFPKGNEQALITALQDLLDHPERVRGVGPLLRERAISTYSWGPVAQALEQVYEELLKGSPVVM